MSDMCPGGCGTYPQFCQCPPPDAEAQRRQRLLADVRDGAWLDAQTFPSLCFAVPGVLPEGFTLLIGAPKVGKSRLMLAVLLAIATGGLAFERLRVNKGRVLYLALEDGDRRMQERCRSLMFGEALPAQFCYLTRCAPGEVVATIEAFLERYPDTVLVVIDTLGKVMPPAMPNETTYQRDYRVGGRLKAISDGHPGLALVALHHDRKAASDDFVERVSGTNGLAGSADTIIVLNRQRQATEGSIMVTGRDVYEAEYALIIEDGRWILDGSTLAAAAAKADEMQAAATVSDTSYAVLRAVKAAGPAGIKAQSLVNTFGKNVYQYLGRLETAGHLTKPSRGHYVALSEVSGVRNESGASDTPNTSDTPLWAADAYDREAR
jgi:hypothetical protein